MLTQFKSSLLDVTPSNRQKLQKMVFNYERFQIFGLQIEFNYERVKWYFQVPGQNSTSTNIFFFYFLASL